LPGGNINFAKINILTVNFHDGSKLIIAVPGFRNAANIHFNMSGG
jgi:hypothetical protein